MKKIEYNTENVKLAVIKNNTKKGVEVAKDFEYAILYKLDEKIYINMLDPVRVYPVFKRLPYANVTQDGFEYGTKLALVNCVQDLEGPCYVLKNFDFKEVFGEKVTLDEIKDYVLESEHYFAERKKIAMKRLKELDKPIKMLKITLGDSALEKTYVKKR